ncbi:MAG: alpha/beta fold hydrolase [Chloroflexota bacterium]|nr:alpha/beta fold hydrolase [Chloroflexota bacterium]
MVTNFGRARVVLRQDSWLDSGGNRLASALFMPEGVGRHPGLIICHGMPSAPPRHRNATALAAGDPDYPALAEMCAGEGFATVVFNFRGTGESEGNFHPLGWVQDLEAVLFWLRQVSRVDTRRIVLLGSSLGAAVAIYVAAHRTEVAGLVAFASPAVIAPPSHPAETVARLRQLGVIRDPCFPPALDAWSREYPMISPVEWVGKVAPRPLLLLHGEADDVVPPQNAYTLFEKAGEPKALHILPGAGHRFRGEGAALTKALQWLKLTFVNPATSLSS